MKFPEMLQRWVNYWHISFMLVVNRTLCTIAIILAWSIITEVLHGATLRLSVTAIKEKKVWPYSSHFVMLQTTMMCFLTYHFMKNLDQNNINSCWIFIFREVIKLYIRERHQGDEMVTTKNKVASNMKLTWRKR